MASAAGAQSAAEMIVGRAASLPTPEVVRRSSFEEVCALAAERTAVLLARAVGERGRAHVALTGGSAGIALARVLPAALTAAGDEAGAVGAARLLTDVHMWFGDERFVPAGDAERNDSLAAGLVEAGVPESNVHRVRGPEDAARVEDAADLLAADLATHGPVGGRFDVVHLGVGPDAHVCSLFPGHPAAQETEGDVVAVRSSPKPPPERVSLTFNALHRARCLLVLAGGSGKACAVRTGLGGPDLASPASCARGQRTTWYVDDAAAALLDS